MWMRKAGAAALFLALTGTAAAQEPPHRHGQSEDGCPMAPMMKQGMGAGHGAMMGSMMRVDVFQPAHLLERKDVLGLSADQVKRLEELKAAAMKAEEEAAAAVQAQHEQLAQAMGAARPNAQEARRHFEAAHAAMGRVHWSKMEAAIQAKAVLTDVQRARAEGWADAAGSRRGMGGAMMGPRMMAPGMGMGMRGGMGPGAQRQDCPARP